MKFLLKYKQYSGPEKHHDSEIPNCDPLQIYNGQSHRYCIYLFGKVHQNTKG